MTPEEFQKLVKQHAKEIKLYVNTRFPSAAGDTALRFINGNFRAQGWQGASFSKWKPNRRGSTALVKSGHLRSANYYTTMPGVATLRNTMPYAKTHNEGGNIKVPVTDKMRKFAWAMYYKEAQSGVRTTRAGHQYQSIEVGRKANRWKALALTKKNTLDIKIEQRQFFPTTSSPSPVLNKAIQRKIEQELKNIFNK